MTGRPRLASASQVGVLAHRVIADLMRDRGFCTGDTPSWPEVLGAVDFRLARHGYQDRAARQTITAAALGYLTVAPRQPWQFLAAELPLPGARLDLVWWNPVEHLLMVDEVKTGQHGVATPDTRRQVERYRDLLHAHGVAPHALVVRAVGTRAPHTAWTLPPIDPPAAPVTNSRSPPSATRPPHWCRMR